MTAEEMLQQENDLLAAAGDFTDVMEQLPDGEAKTSFRDLVTLLTQSRATIATCRQALAARDTLLRHVREVFLTKFDALDKLPDASADAVRAEMRATLDFVLPPTRKKA